MWIVEVLEITLQGQKTGQWRLTARFHGSQPHGLCTHVHNSYESAWNCLEAWGAAKRLPGDS
ncbi:MAG: hypothetical protein V7K68_18040 [Nostoc sp.]|uniref:hypothetical protein n=1 Tax=Nostoc sp. TaxID=1180 RepID=UPI002FF59F08